MLRTSLLAAAGATAAAAGLLLLSLAMTDTGHPLHAGPARNITVIYKTSLTPMPATAAARAPCTPGICQDV